MTRAPSVGWVFPGQGARELPEAVERALADRDGAELVELAAREAGLTGAARALERGARAMERTAVAQPLLAAVCYWLATRDGERPSVCLGQSLGELLAWLVANDVAPVAGIALAARRGLAMEQACEARPGRMLAIAGVAEAELDLALAAAREAGELHVASKNGPRELVLAGEEGAVRLAMRRLGGTLLRTAGAFHTPLMASAVAPYREALGRTPRGVKRARVAWSKPGDEPHEVEEELDWLAESLASPVDFGLAVGRAGADVLLVVGPRSAVLGALRALAPSHTELRT